MVQCRPRSPQPGPGTNIILGSQIRNNGTVNWPVKTVVWLVVPGTAYRWAWETTIIAAPGQIFSIATSPFPVPSGWAGTSKDVMVSIWDPTETTMYGANECPRLIQVGVGVATGEVIFIEAV